MTLTQLAQKHNIPPESAKAFLREWLDMQPVTAMLEQVHPNSKPRLIEKSLADHWIELGVPASIFRTPLIARPTDLGE